MKRLLASFSSILFVTLYSFGQVELTPQRIASESGGSVALIVSEPSPDALGLGTGFFVAPDLVVTNFHVVEGSGRLFVKTSGGPFLESDTIHAFDEERDLAVIKLPNPQAVRPLRIGNSDSVKQGESIVVISNPKGIFENTVSNGLVSAIRKRSATFAEFQISAPISLGSSGGPVFNSKGEVIAVVVSIVRGAQNLNFAIPVNYVKDLLAHPKPTPLAALPKRPGPEPEAPATANVDGSWVATIADEISSGKLYFNLVQLKDGQISGTYTSSQGGGGTISGSLNGNTLYFRLRQSVKDCPGQFEGVVAVESDRGIGNYTGHDCFGDHGTGSATLSRNTGEAPAPQPTAQSKPPDPITEYGRPAELRDVRTVYVYTGDDLEVRQNIIKSLLKYRGISVVEEPVAADVILVYGADAFSMGTFTHIWQGADGDVYGTTRPRTGVAGEGFAAKFKLPNTMRIVWQFSDTRTTLYERRPSTNFARNFIKILKEVRGEK